MSRLIAEWAIRAPTEEILEPSFGGCGFLDASIARLEKLGAKNPLRNLSGCDIDGMAFKHLANCVRETAFRTQFVKNDFLKLRPKDFRPEKFQVILGNPPYVSYHNMFGTQRKAAIAVGEFNGFRLDKNASLWAYIILHSLHFISAGGRMAWLLPGSLLNADYAKKLLKEVAKHFERVAVISLTERLFEEDGTDESSEILLCEGFGRGPAPSGVEIKEASNVEDCKRLLDTWAEQTWRGATLNGRVSFALMQEQDLSTFHRIASAPCVKQFGELARCLIGIVTGANLFFIINRQLQKTHAIPRRALKPILAKFSHAPGICLKKGDLVAAEDAGERCLLLNTDRSNKNPAIEKYLETFPEEEKRKNATFAKRPVWHKPDDRKFPDAFLPYMHHTGPRLVLNTCGVNSTNTIHRIYFREKTSLPFIKLVAISMLSTFSQLSAEIEGRTYGSGVLKHEPSEVSRINLLIPREQDYQQINTTFSQIDKCTRGGKHAEATEIADRMLCQLEPAILDQQSVRQMQTTLLKLRSRRY